MSRAADRRAARREARSRRAELRLFTAARSYSEVLDRRAAGVTVEGETIDAPELPGMIAALTELEAAALNFAEVVPRPARRRGRRRS